MKIIKSLWRDDAGATAIEYALLAGLIAVAVLAAVTLIGQNLQTFFFGPVAGNLS